MIGKEIHRRLAQDGAVVDLIGTRIYPLFLPQNGLLPAVTYIRISGVRVGSLSGAGPLSNQVFQIDCWAKSYGAAMELGAAVRAAMTDNAVFRCLPVGERDAYEPDTEIYHYSIDYSLWYAEERSEP